MEASSALPIAAATPDARLGPARVAARTAAWLSRHLTHGSGHTIGGRMLLALDQRAPASLASGRDITLVSGTNGKTTTAAMLTAALREGLAVATNADGANTPPGLVSALTESDDRHVVLEVDEGWLPWAVERLRPRRLVLLNLSRDQLHRHPEVHRLAEAWRNAIEDVPLVVANADDPAVAWAAGAARRHIWVAAGQAWTLDSVICPACGGLLQREGSWRCSCGLRRPVPAWCVTGDQLRHHGQVVDLDLGLPGDMNLGNAGLAVATAAAVGIAPPDAARAVGALRHVGGRYARVPHGRQSVRLLLAKNPAGWGAALATVCSSTTPLVIAFNADGVDGRDPSWLYDVDFRGLAGRPIAVCGRRGTDMLVRLRMEELAPLGQFDSIEGALHALPDGEVDLVGNYSAFQEARRLLHDK